MYNMPITNLSIEPKLLVNLICADNFILFYIHDLSGGWGKGLHWTKGPQFLGLKPVNVNCEQQNQVR